MKAKPTTKPGGVVLELNRRDEPLMTAASTTASPFRMKRILVPIDFSDCAKKALQYAIPLAKEHQAALTLLYVVPPSYAVGEYGGIDYAQLEASMRVSGDKELAKLAVDEVRAPFQNPIQYVLHALGGGDFELGPLHPEIARIGQQIVDSAALSAREKRTVKLLG